MKTIGKRVHCTPCSFKSANDIISVDLNINNGPELLLDDGSIIVFEDTITYYDVLKHSSNNEIDFDILKLISPIYTTDDVVRVEYEGLDINEVTEFKLKGKKIYRFV